MSCIGLTVRQGVSAFRGLGRGGKGGVQQSLGQVFFLPFIILFLITLFLILFLIRPGIAQSAVPQSPSGSRTFHLVNNCSYPVWFGFAGGGGAARNGGQCGSDSDCYPGSRCVQTGPIRQCFFTNPAPANGDYRLAPKGGQNQVSIPYFNSGSPIVWSGVVSGRMGCAGGSCAVSDCGNDGKMGCLPSRGFNQPATQAEFTLLSQGGPDFYDVEIINGVSVPIEMAPVLTQSLESKVQASSSPYFCGRPGAAVASSSLLGGCSWKFNPPTHDYRWVTAGGPSCGGDRDCFGGSICGLSKNPGKSPMLQKTCGSLIGLWSANEVCGNQPDYGAPFNCQQWAGSGPQGTITLTNLYACTKVGSCYQNGAQSNCCGCVNWDQAGLQVPPYPYTQQCYNSNPVWLSEVKPRLQWMKEGCPTAYTYPYDDMSSTFTCSDVRNNINTVDYVITYCPSATNPVPLPSPVPSPSPAPSPNPTPSVTPPPGPVPPLPPGPSFTQSIIRTAEPGAVQVTFVGSAPAEFVIIHYLVNGTNQQNVKMQPSDSKIVWTQIIKGLKSGDRLTYSFTYWIGTGAVDSSNFSYVFN